MADRVKIVEYLDAEEALRLARQGADHFNENYRIFEWTRGKMGLDPDLSYNQLDEKLAFDEYDAAIRRHNAARASLGDALYGPEVSAERSRRIKAMDIPDEIFDELGPERDPTPSRRPAGSEAAHRYGATARPLPRPGTRGHTQQPLQSYAFPPEDVPGRQFSSRGYYYTGRPNMAGLDERNVRQFLEYVSSRGPSGITLQELLDTTGTPPEFIQDLKSRGLVQLTPGVSGSSVRVPPGTSSKLGLKGERGFISGVAPSARSTAARGLSKAAKVAGPVGLGIDALAAYNQAEGPWSFSKWMAHEEEGLTKKPVLGLIGLGERGLVSPSELPPPEVLSPDRIKAVEATRGVVGVAPDNESPNVTRQELRAYISNKVAKGKKLPAWAEKITSMKGGRLSIKPFDPRAEARQEAAKRPRTWGNVLD